MQSNYQTKKLGELISFAKGKMMISAAEAAKDTLPYIGIENLRSGQYTLYTSENNGVRCDNDDVLLVWDGAYAGTVGIGLRGFVGSTIAKVVHNETLESRYLAYLLQFNQQKIRSAAQGAAVPHLNRTFLENLRVPMPSLNTQQAIAERVDSIREAQKLNDALIEKTDQLFQSLLNKIFGSSSKSWKEEKIGALVVDVTNGFAFRPVGKGIGQIRPNNIGDDGSLNFDSIKYIPQDYPHAETYFLKSGDVLFNNTNSISLVGKSVYIDKDYKYVFSNHITRIRTNEKVLDPRYFSIYLQYLYSTDRFRYLCTPWVNQAAVNSTALKKIKIMVPPTTDQHAIAERFSAIKEYKKGLLVQKEKLKELFDSALSKALAGELVKEGVAAVPVKASVFPVWQAIGAVLQRFERGEMVVAKLLYLAQEVYRVPLGFSFTSQNFGPYDLQIKKAITAGASPRNGFFQQKNGVYGLGANSGKLFKYNSKILSNMESVLNDLMPAIKNSTSAQIECLATVCKVVQDAKSDDLTTINDKIQAWKPNKFRKAEIEGTLKFIKSKGWNKKLIK
ncbi:MAG: restriction endonuclease subunit S [Candidatus Yanofskybacteria bacterium]|nr:restriction endonuclease subunit S [Candidatus Yanofskybacteria bacterium]